MWIKSKIYNEIVNLKNVFKIKIEKNFDGYGFIYEVYAISVNGQDYCLLTKTYSEEGAKEYLDKLLKELNKEEGGV